MVILSNVVDDFINKLKQDAHFENIKIIKAYPYVAKPTRLSKIVLCLSLAEISADNCSVGDNCIYGDYKIDIDIFVPYKIGADVISDVFSNIVNACNDNLPIGISTNNIKNDRDTLCYTAKCSLVFNDALNIGGVNDECRNKWGVNTDC